MGLPGRSSMEEDDSVKLWKMFIVPLIMALLIPAMPVSMAEGTGSAPAQGYRAMEDYTKVHWFVECGDQRLDITGATGQNTVLTVDATPQTSWTISAQFVRVRNSELVPFDGQLDVTRHCSWESEGLTCDDGKVTLPEGEGVYTVTGRFTDEEGQLYVCDIRFDVSEDHVAPRPRLRTRAATLTVEQKVDQLVQECLSKGFDTQYEKALWFHDWLIYNANYDFSYHYYDADGVLLYGTGVCDSYSKAFKLLLDGVGIENERVIGEEIKHAWNSVKLDGVWCHIDCTWDDPGTGGDENHNYFGMSAALTGRDHTWSGSYPTADSLANYYPLRTGQPCFTTLEEFDSIIVSQVNKKANPITALYVGGNPDMQVQDLMQTWMGENNWKYGVLDNSWSYTDYSVTINVEYTDPWEKPGKHLDPPVKAPDFALNGPNGTYKLSDYGDNAVVLIIGRTVCSNTLNLLSRLSGQLSDLNDDGVEVLVSMNDAEKASDLSGVMSDLPGYRYTYNCGDLMWTYLYAAGYPKNQGVTFPCVFVIDDQGKITYYSTGFVYDTGELLGEINAVAPGKKGEYEAVIPKSLTELREEVFANTGFESIDLTNGRLITIRSGAFAGCEKLARIRIPRTVTTIEDGAFTGAENVVIVCADGSAAYRFAVANGLEYILE